ncbi:hypothetical protein KCMC57_up50150 [Kitasatospora sp. CMC57]|uniref:Uncharacterized protein n=1 Tax=Kitasatospora sp. CMC57 TaxID=3231513 RepID=A0AB33JZD9_9ACTN
MANEPVTNNGVQQFGGHSQVGNQAIGQHARALSGPVGFQNLAVDHRALAVELLATVERLLAEHRAELPDGGAPELEVRRLREELAEPSPEPGVLRRALDRLTAIAAPIAPLAVAVAELTGAVQSILGG